MKIGIGREMDDVSALITTRFNERFVDGCTRSADVFSHGNDEGVVVVFVSIRF